MNENFIVLDVETTGLESDDEILQVSIINSKGETLLNVYCKPEVKESWLESTNIHGITPEYVENCSPYSSYKDLVQNIINNVDIIVGYNTHFDLNFVNCNYEGKRIVDVMDMFAPVYGQWNSYFESYTWKDLTTCASYYGYEFEAHNSLDDVLATLYCYPRVLYDYSFNIECHIKNIISYRR